MLVDFDSIDEVHIDGMDGGKRENCPVKNTGRYHKLPYIVEAVRLFLPEEQLYLFRIIWIYPINLE